MKPNALKTTLGFGLMGLLSGILSIPSSSLLFCAPGAVFGLCVAACLFYFTRERAPGKALIFAVTSSAAYMAAFFATIQAYMWLPKDNNPQAVADPPAYIMAVGGVIGAFCVCGAALFLYSPERKRLLSRTLWCSLAGGVLAVIGYGLYSVFSVFETLSSAQTSRDMHGMFTLYPVWQMGVGAVLGYALGVKPVSGDEGYWPGNPSYEARQPEASLPVSRRGSQPLYVTILGWVFIGALCAGLLVYGAEYFWNTHRFANQQKSWAEYKATQPSTIGLAPLEAMDQKEVFILDPIAGTTPSVIGRNISPGRVNRAEFADFSICYMNLPAEHCGGSPPAVHVEILQYPSVAWADYEFRGIAFGTGPGYFQQPKDVFKTGHHILALENPHDRGHGDFYWQDARIVVKLRSNISDPSPFIEAYLEKFPSTN